MPRVSRVVQIRNSESRRLAVVDEPRLRLLTGPRSAYGLASEAMARGLPLETVIQADVSDESLDYEAVYSGASPWRLMAPIDHPDEPSRCLVSGTGLTHLGSASNRQAMHGSSNQADVTDSMRMFRAGVEGGRPAPGCIGAAPEWFFKGCGTVLRAPGEPLVVPAFGEDGGEEAEIAGVYVIDPDGRPRRIGMTAGNEFSDHKFEKSNYLNLASSKLRTCSLGPELVTDPAFDSVRGSVTIERNGRVLWTKRVATGAAEMSHSLANIEHHHFKFDAHRRPGDVHVHYYGAHSLSFGEGVALNDGDLMIIRFEGFGRPLRNPLVVAPPSAVPIAVEPL
jgi:hypothetical protein